MQNKYFFNFRSVISAFVFFLLFSAVQIFGQTNFKVGVDPSLVKSNEPLSGRLLIFMTNNPKPFAC